MRSKQITFEADSPHGTHPGYQSPGPVTSLCCLILSLQAGCLLPNAPFATCLNIPRIWWIKSGCLGLDPSSMERKSSLYRMSGQAASLRPDSFLCDLHSRFSLMSLVCWPHLWKYVPGSLLQFQEGKSLLRGIFRRLHHGLPGTEWFCSH